MLFPMTALLIGDSEFLERLKLYKRYYCLITISKYIFPYLEIRLSGKQVIYGSQNDVLVSL
jgi:hypothetical protein